MEIYSPAEDSFLLSEAIEDSLESIDEEKRKHLLFLDMGAGSGIQAESALKFLNKENIYCVDINKDAVKYIKKLGFQAARSDLFSSPKLKGMKFDIITFNPPYLPEDDYDKGEDTTGGEKGDEVALTFLIVAKNYLKENGIIFLLVSSLTPKDKLEEEIKKQGKMKEVVATKKLFFETLEVWKII